MLGDEQTSQTTSGPELVLLVPSAISLVANAEGEAPTIAPNTWVEIKGSGLSLTGDSRIWMTSDFVKNQLPTQLDSITATVNGKSAFLYYILRVPICEGWCLMPPRWFLRFWTGQAGRG